MKISPPAPTSQNGLIVNTSSPPNMNVNTSETYHVKGVYPARLTVCGGFRKNIIAAFISAVLAAS